GEQASLGLGLDHLRHGADTEIVAEADHRLEHHPIPRTVQDLPDVFAVELDIVDMQRMQILEGGEAGAEIVEAHLVAEAAQLLDHRVGNREVLDLGRFGDLEDEPAPQAAMRANHLLQARDEDLVLQRLGRDIDGYGNRAPGRTVLEMGDRPLADGEVHLVDQVHALGELDQLVRALVALEADQDLEMVRPAMLEIDDRL